MNISIHALREEGDEDALDFLFEVLGFLSTPSARRATAAVPPDVLSHLRISIHALREEGDFRVLPDRSQFINISIHALREEGDSFPVLIGAGSWQFLSTPSARRATERSVQHDST